MSVGRIINGKLAVRDGRLACDCCVSVSCGDEIQADPFALGACCLGNDCFTTHRCLCEQAGGNFLGRGTSCATDRCDQTGPDGGGDPDDPLVCVHYYEARITCENGQEVNGPVNRAGSQCERCSSTDYPANGPLNVNAGWVRESRPAGNGLWADYWIYKYCSRDVCGAHVDCALGGPDPSEFGFTLPEPPPQPQVQRPPRPGDYCYQFVPQGPTLAPYTPLFPNGPEGLPGALSRATGCSGCNRNGGDLEL